MFQTLKYHTIISVDKREAFMLREIPIDLIIVITQCFPTDQFFLNTHLYLPTFLNKDKIMYVKLF